jgi:hypothetical protein
LRAARGTPCAVHINTYTVCCCVPRYAEFCTLHCTVSIYFCVQSRLCCNVCASNSSMLCAACGSLQYVALLYPLCAALCRVVDALAERWLSADLSGGIDSQDNNRSQHSRAACERQHTRGMQQHDGACGTLRMLTWPNGQIVRRSLDDGAESIC